MNLTLSIVVVGAFVLGWVAEGQCQSFNFVTSTKRRPLGKRWRPMCVHLHKRLGACKRNASFFVCRIHFSSISFLSGLSSSLSSTHFHIQFHYNQSDITSPLPSPRWLAQHSKSIQVDVKASSGLEAIQFLLFSSIINNRIQVSQAKRRRE